MTCSKDSSQLTRTNPTYAADLSAARQREAEIRRKASDRAGADAADRERKRLDETYRALTGIKQGRIDELDALHVARVYIGAKLFKGSDHTGALREFKAAESAAREYIRLRPTDFRGYDNLRNIYDRIQDAQKELGNSKERTAALSASMHAAHIAALLAPKDSPTRTNIALLGARNKLGIFLHENNRFDEALAMVQEEVAGRTLGARR